jgi:hypothetical protein
VYFLLFSAYPVITLFANNLFQVDNWVFVNPLITMILCASILALFFYFFVKTWQKSALLTTVFLVFFMSYGHITHLLTSIGWNLSAQALTVAWLALLVVNQAILLIIFKKQNLNIKALAPALNLMAVILLLFPFAKIIRYSIEARQPFQFAVDHYQEVIFPNPAPDIYYIILDGYTRSDVYMEYGYDNSEFISSLENMGFYVAKCSQSNYPNTGLARTSTLNMDYIPTLGNQFAPNEIELIHIFKSLQGNSVRRMLENAGYHTIAYSSGFPWAEMRDASVFYEPPASLLNEFDAMFLSTTAIQALDNLGLIDINEISGSRYRERTRIALASFDELQYIPGPKFVFMHIMSPHAPFVFDSEGNAITPRSAGKDGYINASKFTDKEIAKHVYELILQSPTPPIIIIQGDHWPDTDNRSWRLSILNAYHLPGHTENLYPHITPVNTFRIIFNSYFGTNYPLLEDKSYDAKLPYVYNFTEIRVWFNFSERGNIGEEKGAKNESERDAKKLEQDE